jgi:hypothetical protein
VQLGQLQALDLFTPHQSQIGHVVQWPQTKFNWCTVATFGNLSAIVGGFLASPESTSIGRGPADAVTSEARGLDRPPTSRGVLSLGMGVVGFSGVFRPRVVTFIKHDLGLDQSIFSSA